MGFALSTNAGTEHTANLIDWHLRFLGPAKQLAISDHLGRMQHTHIVAFAFVVIPDRDMRIEAAINQPARQWACPIRFITEQMLKA